MPAFDVRDGGLVAAHLCRDICLMHPCPLPRLRHALREQPAFFTIDGLSHLAVAVNAQRPYAIFAYIDGGGSVQNRSNLGCLGILALVVAIYALWMVVLWVGVPLALVGMFIAHSELKKSRVTESRKSIRQKNNALALGTGSALLGIASIWGNLASAEGPLAKVRGNDYTIDEGEVRRIAYNGCLMEGQSKVQDIVNQEVLAISIRYSVGQISDNWEKATIQDYAFDPASLTGTITLSGRTPFSVPQSGYFQIKCDFTAKAERNLMTDEYYSTSDIKAIEVDRGRPLKQGTPPPKNW